MERHWHCRLGCVRCWGGEWCGSGAELALTATKTTAQPQNPIAQRLQWQRGATHRLEGEVRPWVHRARGWPSRTGAGLGIAQGSAPKKGQRQPCCCCLLHVVFCLFFFAAAVQDTVSIAARLSSVKPLLGTFSPQLSPPVFSGSLQLINMDKLSSPYSTSATRPTAQCPAGQADRSTGQRPPPGQPRTLESENIMARLAGVCLGFRVSSNNARGRGSVECLCHQCNHRSDYFARVFGASPHLCTTSPACRDKIPPVPFLDFQLSVPGANGIQKSSRTIRGQSARRRPAAGAEPEAKPPLPSILRSNQIPHCVPGRQPLMESIRVDWYRRKHRQPFHSNSTFLSDPNAGDSFPNCFCSPNPRFGPWQTNMKIRR